MTDEQAEYLVSHYADLILRIGKTWLGDMDDAKDICQTVLIKLLENPRKFPDPGQERAWVVRIAINECKSWRKTAWFRHRAPLDDGLQLTVLDPEPEDDGILALVQALPAMYREVIFLRYNGQRMQLKIYDLTKGWYDKEKQKYTEEIVCGGTWDFGEMTISFPHSTIYLEPNVPVTTLDVEATITEIMISPISVQVRIEGDALKGHHSWVNAPDGYYGCIDYQEIKLYSEDGSITTAEYIRAGSGCRGGKADSEDDGLLILRRNYSRSVNDVIANLVDVDNLTAISVCDTMIPLR